MQKRFAYRTAIAGIAAVAVLAPSVVAPNSAFGQETGTQTENTPGDVNAPEAQPAPEPSPADDPNNEPAPEPVNPAAQPVKAELTLNVPSEARSGKIGFSATVTNGAEGTIQFYSDSLPIGAVQKVGGEVNEAKVETLIVNPGEHKISAKFTPADSTKFAPSEASATVKVAGLLDGISGKVLANSAAPVAVIGTAPLAADYVLGLPKDATAAWKDVAPVAKDGQPGAVEATVVVTLNDGTTQEVPVKVQFVKDEKQFKGAAAGLGLSLLLGLTSIFQIHGLKDANTKVQQQLGIFNPQLAATADSAFSKLGPIVGLAGLITSAIFLSNSLTGKPEIKQLPKPGNTATPGTGAANGASGSSQNNAGADAPKGSSTNNATTPKANGLSEFFAKVKNFFANLGKPKNAGTGA